MNRYNEGDRISATLGSAELTGEVTFKFLAGAATIKDSDMFIRSLEASGWSVVITEAAPPRFTLPTEPGIYNTERKYINELSVHYRLDTHGQWFVIWTNMSPQSRTAEEMIAGISGKKIVRLEQPHETAKKVLDRLSMGLPTTPAYIADNIAKIVAAVGVEFGVGGDE